MPTAVESISIDVLHDLANLSSLKDLLSSQKSAIFGILGEVVKFAGHPVKDAAAAKANASITLNAPASWTLPNGIVFSLNGSAGCSIAIDTVSESFDVATSIDADHTTRISAGPQTGVAYINIDLNFSIQGNVAGGANIGALGISGTIAGAKSATVSFSQPVDETLDTVDAIKLAFSQIVFPLDATRIRSSETGSLTRVVFDGTFSAELDVAYGLADHTFSAPGIITTLNSAQKVVSLTPPSVEIESGVSATISYSHTDHFCLIIDKTSDTVATVTLARALASDAGVSAGFNFGVTVTNITVAVNPDGIQGLVKKVTGNDTLASEVSSAAASGGNSLLAGLNAKLASWATSASGQIGLTAGLERQTSRATLFNFEADLTDPNLTQASWSALVSGDIAQALRAGGLKLQPGSGVSESLNRSATIHFQFFNLFAFDRVTDFFQNSSATLGPDGSIRLLAKIGEEQSDTTKKTLSTVRLYFSVSANQNNVNTLRVDDIDLRVELIEANRPGKGATFEETLTQIPGNPVVNAAQDVIGRFIGANGASKLSIVYDIKPSAYKQLSSSSFTANGKPSSLPQTMDSNNWIAFRNASTSLKVAPNGVAGFTYQNWIDFNRAANDQIPSTMTPNRLQLGDINAGKLALPDNGQRDANSFFIQASQGFMNFIADIAALAIKADEANDRQDYDDILRFLDKIVNQDVFADYIVPIAGALVHLSSVVSANLAVDIDQASDNSALICTVTLS